LPIVRAIVLVAADVAVRGHSGDRDAAGTQLGELFAQIGNDVADLPLSPRGDAVDVEADFMAVSRQLPDLGGESRVVPVGRRRQQEVRGAQAPPVLKMCRLQRQVQVVIDVMAQGNQVGLLRRPAVFRDRDRALKTRQIRGKPVVDHRGGH
jgi:hypothetical protein